MINRNYQSKQDSLYFQLWDKVQPFRVKLHSDVLWTMPSIPESHKRNIFKNRTGQIWNKKIAFKRHMSYMPGQPIARDTRCPLCRGDDSQGHIFGSCMHPDMSKQYIARHDKAMTTLIQDFTKGQCGSHYLIADVGKIEGLTWACTVREFQPLCSQTDVYKQGAWTLRWREVSCRGEQQTHGAR